MDFSKRSQQKEHLDGDDLSKKQLELAFKDINRCNKLLGGNALTIKAVKKVFKKHPKKSYTILDMGCGDGEMLRILSQALKKFPVDFIGVDINKDVLETAKIKSKIYTNITFVHADILRTSLAQSDIVLCTLTLHHFKSREIIPLVKKLAGLSRLAVIINDLQRSGLAYHLFKVFGAVLLSSKIAISDGLVSIRRGFVRQELNRFAFDLNEFKHRIRWKWAFRYEWIVEHYEI